uniref:Uncharacterized protein n=1 Tax=Apteryx owenii TaxID=8824 RepID=A0A8B9PCK8_APTOW
MHRSLLALHAAVEGGEKEQGTANKATLYSLLQLNPSSPSRHTPPKAGLSIMLPAAPLPRFALTCKWDPGVRRELMVCKRVAGSSPASCCWPHWQGAVAAPTPSTLASGTLLTGSGAERPGTRFPRGERTEEMG